MVVVAEGWCVMRARVEAVVLVAVVMATGYLVGMVATGAVRAWLEGMPL